MENDSWYSAPITPYVMSHLPLPVLLLAIGLCDQQVTLRSYLGMLRMVDRLRSQKPYRRASALLVRAYLKLYDEKPRGGGADGSGLPDMSNMTAAEKKRIKSKVGLL